jgi:hypothetical protein
VNLPFIFISNKQKQTQPPQATNKTMSSLTTSNNPVWYECVLCHGDFGGYGNNPAPFATDGRCCDTCNFTKVFRARLTGIVPVLNTEPDMYSIDSDSEEEQEADSDSEDEQEAEEPITTCHCKPDWDFRCGCFPPVHDLAESLCEMHTGRSLFWHKAEHVRDNWARCPNRIAKAVEFAHESLHDTPVDVQCQLLNYMGLADADVAEAKEDLKRMIAEDETSDQE